MKLKEEQNGRFSF